ncbi:MAG: IS256 family transposase [Verrucomicrobiota bacterium]
MDASYRKPPVLAIEDLGLELGELRGDPLESLARFGVQLVLSSYLEAEVSAHLGAAAYERTPARRGSRNGKRPRKVTCGVGTVDIDFPKVRNTETPFQSALLDAWQRTSRSVTAMLPSLYVEGLSTRDFARALKPLHDGAGLSRSTVSRANEQIKAAFDAWRRRSLAEEEIVYLFLDGHFEGLRMGTREKEALLVVHGITKAGKRAFLGVYVGGRESTEAWKLALEDLIERGLRQPLLVISDGNAGLIRAVKDIWPTVLRQRCVVHRARNVLARVPKKDRPRLAKALNRIFYANSLDEALAAARAFAGRWQNVYPAAVETLGRDLADCLTFLRFPPRHWRRLRTSNILERSFEEVKRRTRVIRRFPNERAAVSLVWSVLDQDAAKWRGIIMDAPHWELIQGAIRSLAEDPIIVIGFEELLAA